ncbi:MAG: DEAD/DEAH box helicase [Thermoleophilia bacterium]|nr:DEAD/DEAH box helicase [Thermoleophilia bacterium]
MGRSPRLSGGAFPLLEGDERIARHVVEPARREQLVDLPEATSPDVRDALGRAGITQLYPFQHVAAQLLSRGRHVALAGGTGAGKSLCYQLPLLEALLTPLDLGAGDARGTRKQTALYLAPTKSLAQDQARRLRELGASWARPMLYDGDTPPQQRAIIRKQANLLLTNPDMLSAGILPNHAEWATFLRGLAIVVIDESHVYRGIFGSHVAQVIRRLRRLLAIHGNTHATFCLSSATIGNPLEHAERLTGIHDFELVGDEGAPRAARDLVLWNPELDEETGDRDSAIAEAARMYASLIERGVPTIVFANSRKSCELIHKIVVDQLGARGREDLAAKISPYRAGYTPEERRATERDLAAGTLLGVVATSALELGIDIGSLEASIVVTFPGTITSLRQRWGRAARSAAQRGLCVLIAGQDALDQYFMRHPEELLERNVEHAIVSTRNPRIVLPHVLAAASEAPLGGAVDAALWGALLEPAIDQLISAGQVARTPSGVAFTGRGYPAGSISMRSSGQGDVQIIERGSGQLLGSVEIGRAASTVYPGAVYLHRAKSYLVEELDTRNLTAIVGAKVLPYYTLPKIDTNIEVLASISSKQLAGTEVVLHHGRVVVTDQLVAYQRMHAQTHTKLDLVDAHLPPLTFETEAVWFAAPAEAVQALQDATRPDLLLGALHAAEHGMIAMLPLIATCDRWDIGGLSIDWHETFQGPGIFIYDGHPGGIGLTETGFARIERWLEVARVANEDCPCDDGCPSCVQSPKCGNLNEPLEKAGAALVLRALQGARELELR